MNTSIFSSLWEEQVVTEILKTVRKAEEKFPLWPVDPIHQSAILQEECGELVKATIQAVYEPEKNSENEVLKEAFQTAAMAIRFLLHYNNTADHTKFSQYKKKTTIEDFISEFGHVPPIYKEGNMCRSGGYDFGKIKLNVTIYGSTVEEVLTGIAEELRKESIS